MVYAEELCGALLEGGLKREGEVRKGAGEGESTRNTWGGYLGRVVLAASLIALINCL